MIVTKKDKPGIWPWIAAILVVAVWAETFISSKVLLTGGMEPADIFFFRFTLAYLGLWIVCPKRLFARNIKDELTFFFLGITGGSLYFLLENTALEYSTASNVAILVGSAPLATALLVSLVHKEEKMSGRQLAGSAIAFIGMALVVFNGKFILKLNPLGDALALGAALTWGFYSLVIRRVSDRYEIRFITRKVFFYGLVTILPYFALVEPLHLDWEMLSRPAVWGNLVYLAVVASFCCFLTWNWALTRLGTIRTTNLIYGQCFFTMLIANIVLGEEITWMAVLGTVILIIGMINAVRQKNTV